MKTITHKLILLLFAVVAGQGIAFAGVSSYAIFKVANYHQVDSSPPTALNSPDAYYFGAQLFSTNGGEVVTNAAMTAPDSEVYPMPGNPVPAAFYYNTPYFPAEASMNATLPNGTYLFTVNDGTDSGELTIPAEDLFTGVIPCFTGDTWGRLQSVDAGCPLRLCWNAFVPNPGASSAFIFVRILDPSFNYAYTTNYIPTDVTNICIPADSLEAGTIYTIQLLFSDRADAVDHGFDSDAAATAGFDVLTYTSLITVPPKLRIAPGTNAVILSWSVSASNFALESTTQLSPPITWCPVTNAPAVICNRNVVCLPACAQAKFYQLYAP